MNSLKTYNIDHDCIAILARQPNQSHYVCRAFRRLYHLIDEVSPADFPTRQLLAALHARNDISGQMKAVILAELSLESKS